MNVGFFNHKSDDSCVCKCLVVALIIYAFTFLNINPTFGQSMPELKLRQVFSGLSSPVAMSHIPNDNRIFIVERRGRIKIAYPNGTVLETPFLDITDRVIGGGEKGLLGLAFPPNYKNSGQFFVYYTGISPLKTIISRYRVSSDSNIALKETEEQLLTFNQPFENHNGGCIEFGSDGYLYIGVGDGGSGGDPMNFAQNKLSYLGKMLRINVNTTTGYNIPASNPWVGDSDYLPELWAMGYRNPWKFAFDPHNDNLWIADVGQNAYEEVDFEPAGWMGGANYGWRCYEGEHPYNTANCNGFDSYQGPVAEYNHGTNNQHCSIIGGKVYVKNPESPLYGNYLYADYCSGNIWGTKYIENIGFDTRLLKVQNIAFFTTFGNDYQDNIYIARENGLIYRIDTLPICSSKLNLESSGLAVGCDIESVTLKTDFYPNGTYTWFKNGIQIQQSNSDSILVNTLGQYTVSFRSDSCKVERSDTVTIVQNTAEVTISGLPDHTCIGADPFELVGNPPGGLFFGDGVVGNFFDPSLTSIGIHSVTYAYDDGQGCEGFSLQMVNVHTNPTANILTKVDTVCLEGAPLLLTAAPKEGSFSGPGVSGDQFYPQVNGVGTYTIYYTVRPYQGCESIDSINVIVVSCVSETKNKVVKPLSIFPNPTSEVLGIKMESWMKGNILIKINDLVGQELIQKSINVNDYLGANEISLSVRILPPGQYVISILNQKQIVKAIFQKL